MDRKNSLTSEITEMASDLSGFAQDELDPNTTFLRLGFDSLFLTQLAAAFQKRWKVKITFRQLIEATPNIAALAAFLDDTLPKEMPQATREPDEPIQSEQASAPPVTLSEMPSIPLADTTSPSDTALEAVFAKQLQLMQQQIALLTGEPVAVGSASVLATSMSSTADNQAADRSREQDAVEKPKLPKGFGPSLEETTEEVTPEQRAHIMRLAARYNAKTAGSKERTQRDRQHHADPRTAAGFNPLWKEVVYPLVIKKSYGAHLWDVDDNKYVDMLNGFGPNFFGHKAPFVTDAIRKQLDDGFEVGPQTPLAGEAAKLFCELTGMDRVSWVNTGSEAVQAAIRIARTYTGRDKIVLFSGDYHGNFDEVLVRKVGTVERSRTMPLAPGIPQESVSNVIVLDYGEESALKKIAEMADEIACVLVEPVQSRRPEFQPTAFLRDLRKLTEDQGIVLVFDEVITGFRSMPGGAQEYFGVRADLATYGKIIGGGMPIGVVAGRKEYMDTFDGGHWSYGDDSKPTAGVTFFAGTFVRHPMTIAAVHATLSYLKAAGPALQEGVNARAKRMATSLNEFFQERSVKIFVAQFSSQMFFRVSEESELATLFFYHLRDRGVHILEGFPSYMTAAHTEEDVDYVIDAVKNSVLEMQADGVLPLREGVQPIAYDRPVNLTPAQQEIWATCQLGDGANAAFNESDRLTISGPVDTERLLKAVGEAVNTPDIFRAQIDESGTVWTAAEQAIPVDFLDLEGCADGANEKIDQLATSLGGKPFDLNAGSLVRVCLVKLASDRHELLVFAHHIAFDGYSAALLVDDIVGRYDGVTTDPLPQFEQFALATAASSVRRRSLDYWAKEFSERTPEALALPTDRPFPELRTYTADTARLELHDLAPRVRAFAREKGVTASTVYLTAFAGFLSAISGQDEVVVGLPTAVQATVGIDAIGNGTSMLPLLFNLDGGRSFEAALQQTQSLVANAVAYPHVTLLELLERVDVARDPARPTLVQAVFNFSAMLDGYSLGEGHISAAENPRQFLAYDLFANISETDGKIIADWEFAADALNRRSVENWIEIYTRLLRGAMDNPAQPMGSLPLLEASVVQALLSKLNGGAPVEGREETALVSILNQIEKTPDAIAVSQGSRKLSYAELGHRAGLVAGWLRSEGVAKGDIVGVLMERTPETLAVLLGIWQAGAAYLPLDPDTPTRRLEMIVEDATPAIVLADEAGVGCLDSSFATLVNWEALKGRPHAIDGDVQVGPNDTAYLLYTSGSTGKPKGVINTHGPLMNFLTGLSVQDDLGEIKKVLALTTLGFDISIIETLYPLTLGAEVVIVSSEDAVDGVAIGAIIEREKPDMMQATPSTYRLLLDAGWRGSKGLIALSGGEALTPDIVEGLTGSVRALWNFYGPTEASVYATCTRIDHAEDIHIGRPMPGVSLYILDKHDRVLPPNVVGELCIGGVGVCSGYLGRSEETARRFVHDPFHKGSERLYRTGDLAKVDEGGRITLLGRADSQVKLRGFRIELGEIEAALSEHDDVVSAAAVVDGRGSDAALIAYVQYREGTAPTASVLRRLLRERLPRYMIPQFFVDVPNMPLNPAGKLDRNALPEMAASRAPATPVLPRNDLESAIADIWKDMLGVSAVSVNDNFFELGGQSLQAAQMVARVKRSSGRRIAPRSVIFESLAQLAEGAEAV